MYIFIFFKRAWQYEYKSSEVNRLWNQNISCFDGPCVYKIKRRMAVACYVIIKYIPFMSFAV